MAIRMTGMISGMDTESIVKQLMDAHKFKNKKTTDKQTLLTWKQDKWKELNTKLYKLYTDDLSKLRLQGNYQTKKVTSSHENLVTVTGTATAPEGAHELKIDSLASSQYVTSGQLDASVKSTTKLTELGIQVETLFNFTSGNKKAILEVTSNTTVADFVNKAKEIGLNASFDTTQGRFFISSKESGTKNAFEITATTSTATTPKNDLLTATNYSGLSAAEKAEVNKALAALTNDVSTEEDIQHATDILAKYARYKVIDKEIREEVTPIAQEETKNAIRNEVMARELILLQEEARQEGKTEEEIEAITEENLTEEQLLHIQSLQEEQIEKSSARIASAVEKKVKETIAERKASETDNPYTNEVADSSQGVQDADALARTLASTYKINSTIPSQDASGQLELLKMGSTATVVAAQDSKITYNGVELTGTSNVFTVNGLTMTLKGVSAGEKISLNVSKDTQAAYDMVKNFIKNYNEILKEMNTLYGAPSTRGYDPLSDEEREAMTDDQIEKWETKIKDSVLRRDGTLNSIIDTMRTSLYTSVEVDGKKYSLSSFGIVTSSDYTEKGLLHLQGDKDDPLFADMTDKLMKALEENPDTVIKVLSGITTNLYENMQEKMSAIPNFRSALTFYNDKEMDKLQEQYKKQIKKQEDKLLELENKYYKQFSAMEVALAKMQKQSSALAGLLGTSYNQ